MVNLVSSGLCNVPAFKYEGWNQHTRICLRTRGQIFGEASIKRLVEFLQIVRQVRPNATCDNLCTIDIYRLYTLVDMNSTPPLCISSGVLSLDHPCLQFLDFNQSYKPLLLASLFFGVVDKFFLSGERSFAKPRDGFADRFQC